jgi:hypothetical protein
MKMQLFGSIRQSLVFVLLMALLFQCSVFLVVQPVSAAPNLSLKWTRNLGGNARTFVPPLSANLVGDSALEVIIIGGTSDGGWDGTLTVLNGNSGSTIWQRVFPFSYNGHQYGVGMHTYFEISDLDNDGDNEIIIAAEGGTLVLNGADGSVVWANTSAPGAENYVAVADVDGDGFKEVYVNEGDAIFNAEGMDWITMLSYDGRILHQGYSWHPCWGGITIGDPAHDGNFILFQGDRSNPYPSKDVETWLRGGQGLRALDALTLTPLWTTQNILMSSHAPMLADVDNDGVDDVVVAWQSDGIAVFNASDGSVLDSGGHYRASSSIPGVHAHSQPTVADLDSDGHLEMVVAYSSQPVVWDLYDWRQDARLVDENGAAIQVFEPPKAGDVTGDGRLDTIAVTVPGDIYIFSNGVWSAPVEHVYAGFGGASAFTLVQDIDNDGRNELVVTSSWGVTACFDTLGITSNPRPRTENMFYSESRRGAAEYVAPPTPDQPTLNSEWPLDTSVNQVLNPVLSVSVADYQKNPMTINFQTNVTGMWTTIRSFSGALNGVFSAATSGMNTYGTKYYWRVTASDGSHIANETYSFTTLSTPPTQQQPTLVNQSDGSLVASNVSTADANGDKVSNIYTWFVDGVPYSNLYLPFDTRASSNQLATVSVFSEGFESGWGGFVSTDSWTRVSGSGQIHSGSFSAYGSSSATYLVSNYVDISAGEGLTVSFWYKGTISASSNHHVYLDYWDNDSAYTRIFALDANELADGQWHFYSSQTFTARFNRDDFRFRIDATELTGTEGIWIDDVSVVVPPRTLDYSGLGNYATVHGAQWTPNGVVGGAYVFNGRTDYIRIPDTSSLDGNGAWNQLSIEFWIKPMSESMGPRIIAKKVAGDSTGEYMVGFQTSGSPSNTLFFGIYNGNSWNDLWDNTNTHLAAGSWYHVVCTYESGPGLKIYINGTLRASKALSGPIFDPDASKSVFGAPLFIGQDGSGDQSRRYFNGVLDEIQIYNHALSAPQVMLDYLDAGNGQSSHATIVQQETATGQTWTCTVTPNDGFGDGIPADTNSIKIGDSPPIVQYGLLVQVSGSGTTNATGTTLYNSGTVVAVLASPSGGWVLDHWLLNGTNVGSTNPYSVTMTANRSLTAVFTQAPVQQYGLLVQVVGSGLTNATGTTLYNSGTVVAVQAFPSGGWVLDRWLLDGTNVGSANPYAVTMTANRNLTAVFTQASVEYLFSDGFESGGFGAWNGGTTVTSGETATVGATLPYVGVYGAVFSSNGGGGSEAAYVSESLSAQSELYVRGYFRVGQSGIGQNDARFYFIRFRSGSNDLAYAGWRMVGGVLRWSLIMRSGTGWVDASSSVSPSVGQWYSVELHWRSDAVNGVGELFVDGQLVCSISGVNTAALGSVNTVRLGLADIVNCAATATYADNVVMSSTYVGPEGALPNQYVLTVNVSGSGSVARSPNQASYAAGTVVTLTAAPAAGWSFSAWGGDLSGSANPTTITMTDNRTVTATFTENPSGTLFSDGFESGGFGGWNGGATVTSGETATVGSSFPYGGVYGAVFSSNGGGGSEAAYVSENLVPSQSELYARGYFYVGLNGIAQNDDRFYFMRFRAGSNDLAYAGWRMVGGVLRWSLIMRSGTGWVDASSSVSPSVGQWYSVELHWRSDAVNGVGELYVNGVLVCSISGVNTSALGNVSVVRFGLADVVNCDAVTVYADDCVLSTSYITP